MMGVVMLHVLSIQAIVALCVTVTATSPSMGIRTSSWSFRLLFNEPDEIAVAHLEAVPADGRDMTLVVDEMIWGPSTRTVLRLPNDLVYRWEAGRSYVVSYRLDPPILYAVGRATPELIELLEHYRTLHVQAGPGNLPLDAEGSFMRRIRSLLPQAGDAGELARGFLIGGQLRRDRTDPVTACCDIAWSLAAADWLAIAVAARSPAIPAMTRSDFLVWLSTRVYLQGGPTLVADVMIDWSRELDAKKGTQLYEWESNQLVSSLADWIERFLIPDRIAFLVRLQQSGRPELVKVGNTLRYRPWYNPEVRP